MASKILLYDLPTKGPEPRTWSPNPLKVSSTLHIHISIVTHRQSVKSNQTRLLLAYKGLPYETQWVEFPDVKSTVSKPYRLS